LASIYQSIEILSKEKGVDAHVILDAVKDALMVAARKHFRTEENMAVDFDPKTGAILLFIVKNVVEEVTDKLNELTLDQARKLDPKAEVGGVVRIPKNADALGRISAQTAKQVILQKVREAERENIFSEFSGRVGDLLHCTVKRIEGQDMVVDLGKTEARLPKKEQSRLENFTIGDRIRVVIKSVEKTGKNAGVIVSRASADLVQRLFEQEVPEIYDSTVQIKGCAREAGERTKIAVHSRDRDVDSVGACVGMKGMRVQSIIRELRGEKIDIIEFSEDIATFATHALSPARITRVAIIDPNERHMEVIVDDTQLSLAIGKKGQNVRLAAKLLGWHIDIKSEEEKRQEVESQMAAVMAPGAPVSVLIDHGLPEGLAELLIGSGIGTVEKLGSMTPEDLAAIEGIEADNVETIQSSVISYYQQFETEAAPPPQEFVGGMPIQPPLGVAPAAAPVETEVALAGEETTAVETAGEEIAEPPAEAVEAVQTSEEEAVADSTQPESDNIRDSE
jgi:transcription termination/antitermination protein NusA